MTTRNPNGWSLNGERLFKMWIKSLLDKCLTKRETWSRPRAEVKRNPGPSLAVATLTTPATPQGPNSCLNPICSSAHLFYSIDTSFNFVLQHSPTVYYSNFLCSNNSSHLIRSHFNSIRMKTALEFHLIQLPVLIFLFHLIIFFFDRFVCIGLRKTLWRSVFRLQTLIQTSLLHSLHPISDFKLVRFIGKYFISFHFIFFPFNWPKRVHNWTVERPRFRYAAEWLQNQRTSKPPLNTIDTRNQNHHPLLTPPPPPEPQLLTPLLSI